MKKIIAVLLAVTLILTGAFFAYAIAETQEDAPSAAPLIDLTGLIIAVLALVFDFLLAWIARVIIPPIKAWLKERTTEKQRGLIWDATEKLVDAAEQIIIGPGQGKRRMAYVQAGLQQRGFTVDTDLIEAAVKRMNERAKITAWDAFDMDEDEETTAETEAATEDDMIAPVPMKEDGEPDLEITHWNVAQLRSFCVLNNIPAEGCKSKGDYLWAIEKGAATEEPDACEECKTKDYCELDENGNPIPEEPQSKVE